LWRLTWPYQIGIRCAGVGQLHNSLGRPVAREGQGDELAATELEREPAVELDQRFRNAVLGGDEWQHRLHRGHDEAGGEALTGDISHDHVDAAIGAPEDVEEVTRNNPRRKAARGHLPTRTAYLGRGQKTALHVAGHLQLAPSELLCDQLFELEALDKVAPSLGIERCDLDFALGCAGEEPFGNELLVGGLDRRRSHPILARQLAVAG